MCEKVCRGCGRKLPLSEYYVHKEMSDGRLNFCKDCVRDRVKRHREKNLERIRAYDRERGHRHSKEYELYYRTKHNDRYRAGNAVSNALRDGKMEKPDTCSECGARNRRIEAHHWDYSKPLDVQWVCTVCHKELDKQRRAIEGS